VIDQVKIWFQNRRMKWKRGKKASMEARAKQNAAASDKSKPEPETRSKPEVEKHNAADNNAAAHARNADYGRRIAETGSGGGCKMAAVIGNELYTRRPTSVIAFSVPSKMAADEQQQQQRACVNDRKADLSPFRVMSLTS